MEGFLNDVRHAFRVIVRFPLFNLAVVLILALGIAGNSAIFSIIQRALLNPIPSRDSRQLVVIENALLSMDGMHSPNSPILDWGNLLHSFESLTAYRNSDGGLNLSDKGDNGEPARVEGIGVSASFFHTFQINAELGRTFLPEEEQPGRNRVAILSHSLWQRHFGVDDDIIGKTILLNEVTYSVVGVAPSEFSFPPGADLWIPISLGKDRIFAGPSGVHNVIGRLKHGVSADQAQLEVNALRQKFKQENPGSWIAERQLRTVLLLDKIIGDVRLLLLLLWSAVGFVQLIVCANVANLLLSRGLQRRKEIAVCAALGASPFTLFRRLLIESLMLSLIACAAGLVGAYWFLKFIVAYTPSSVRFLSTVNLDVYAVTFTLILSLATGVVVGLAPCFQAIRVDVDRTLKEESRQSGESGKYSRFASGLVILEVALALVLLIGAGLLIRSFNRVLNIESGINTSNVLTAAVSLPRAKYTDSVRSASFFDELIGRIRMHSSVRSVGAINNLPMGKGDTIALLFEIVGRPKAGKFTEMFANDLVVTTDYFTSMGIPLIEGRYFTEHDRANSNRVAIINKSFARRFWSNESPVGKQLKLAGEEDFVEIIGVVGDVRHFGIERNTMFEIYTSYLQSAVRLTTLVIKSESEPLKLASTVRREIQALDPNLPVYDIKTMEQQVGESMGNRHFITFVLSIFAAVAVALAGIGIYSVITYSVSQRTREIGIRMALGAERRQILALVIGKAMTMSIVGTVIGIVSAVAVTRVLSGLLYGLEATDMLTFSITTLGLLVVTLISSFLPAYRATKIDPLDALRCQ